MEVKSILDKQAFTALLNGFQLTADQAVTQHNHYFETASFALKEQGAALRVREIAGAYTLTLKQPHQDGKLETHQPLDAVEWEQLKEEQRFPNGDVYQQLSSLKIPLAELAYAGTLTTKRIELAYKGGLLCFDESHFFDQVDYEIEFEGMSLTHAEETLSQLLQQYGISASPAENKVRRFFRRKHQLADFEQHP
ncbi:CYTH domain-containing protein [Halalkalibacter oceani]|uniref:CYTH domain-containing protein n=1 Tax=Halalkalibacter oceani TaxID=1653776 RepID=A0A9X2DRF4_9BACI|nr:CYTH domain-containing protein [Halalkalibacter oceani]MCM3715589.1 CYTH domain-containing protein [Halalkalibacter oceani]